MDDKQLAAARARVGRIENQIASLVAKQRETEAALATDHANVREAASRRENLVAQLVGASDGTATAKLHRDIDGLDTAIRVGERLAEGRQKLLATTAQEIESLRSEFDVLGASIAAEENGRALGAFNEQFKQALRNAGDAIATARVALAQVNGLAASGVERFRGAGAQVVEPGLEKFVHENAAANAEAYGWRRPPQFYTNQLSFMVTPMVRQ